MTEQGQNAYQILQKTWQDMVDAVHAITLNPNNNNEANASQNI